MKASKMGATLVAASALLYACSSSDDRIGGSSAATTLEAPQEETLPLPDSYNTSIAFLPNPPTAPGPGVHLATFTYGDPDRQIGYAAIDAGNFTVKTWAPATSTWGPPAGLCAGCFQSYTDNAQVFALPGVNESNPFEQAFVVVAGVSDVWADGGNGFWRNSGVAVVMTTDGGQTWGQPQLIYDIGNCAPDGCGDGINFYAQVDDSLPTNPQLLVEYRTPDIYDPNYPYGFHMVRWQMNQPTDDHFTFHDALPYNLPLNYNGEFTHFRFAVGKCAASGGTCVAGDQVIVGIPGGYPGDGPCPLGNGDTVDAKWGAIAWHQGDTSWTDLSPTAPVWEDPASPNCLDGGNYPMDRSASIIFEPFTNRLVAAFPSYLHDTNTGPFGARINLFEFAPFNMALNVEGEWQLSENPATYWFNRFNRDTEVNEVMPRMLFTTDPSSGQESFGLTFLSNTDNIALDGNNDFGGLRVVSVNSGALLPPTLPAALGMGQLPFYDASSSDPNYLLYARTTGLDAIACGNHVGFYADPNAYQVLAPFTF